MTIFWNNYYNKLFIEVRTQVRNLSPSLSEYQFWNFLSKILFFTFDGVSVGFKALNTNKNQILIIVEGVTNDVLSTRCYQKVFSSFN